MKAQKSTSWVLRYECIGFALIVLVVWIDELTGLGRFLLGSAARPGDWRDSLVETLLIVLVWAGVFIMTKRLVAHSLYLEGLLRICAWCRKVGYRDKWVPMEDYFAEGFHVRSTHGICPECLKKLEQDTAQFRKPESSRADRQPSRPAKLP